MADNKQFILAIVLSALVILAWQYFVGVPHMEQQTNDAPQQVESTTGTVVAQPSPRQGRPLPSP
jgi:YidC/Oxa1 family membrane protein insertase